MILEFSGKVYLKYRHTGWDFPAAGIFRHKEMKIKNDGNKRK